MIPIIIRELRDRRISIISYTLAGIGLLWMYVAIFPSVQQSAKDFEKLFQSYPKAVYQALGVQELTFNTLAKFLAVEQFSFVWPILAITFAMSRAGNTLAGETERGTIGLLLSLPISRGRLFAAKYLATLASILLFVVLTIAAVLPLAALHHVSIDGAILLRLIFVACLFIWAIFAVCIFLSALFNERSKVYMLAGGSLLLMYAANVVASLQSSLAWLHRFSIFNYFNAQDILSGRDIRISSVVVFSVTILIFTVLGSVSFAKRDISC